MDDTISKPVMEPLLSANNNLFGFERGPRYGEYAKLRESKLLMKQEFHKILKEEEARFLGGGEQPTKIHQTRFGFKLNPNPSKSWSSLAQSVPDFSAMIRKENRRPVNSNMLPRGVELTPPPTKTRNVSVFHGSASSTRGSISASAGEKKSRAMMTRKSYANVEDLKKLSMAAASSIHGGGGRRKSLGGGRPILGLRQIY